MPVLRNLLKTLTPPARERPDDWAQHPDYFVGKEALGKDDPAAARDAFLRAMRFWDVSDPYIVCLAQSLRRSGDRETAVAMFG